MATPPTTERLPRATKGREVVPVAVVVEALALHAATSEASVEPIHDRAVETRRDAIYHWSAALARGDDAEVDRLVRQSRIDRLHVAASGQLGVMVGQSGPTAPSEAGQRSLPPTPDSDPT